VDVASYALDVSMTAVGRASSAWRAFVPRWFPIGVFMAVLAGATFLTAKITRNWSIVPAGIFLGALTGPLAFSTWINDRTRVGRCVSPDVLFMTFLVGGGAGTIFAGSSSPGSSTGPPRQVGCGSASSRRSPSSSSP
jgi:hypothetical protein